eukprot:6208284-Pleurochrysis_carterae.AAC.2
MTGPSQDRPLPSRLILILIPAYPNSCTTTSPSSPSLSVVPGTSCSAITPTPPPPPLASYHSSSDSSVDLCAIF